LGLISLWSGTYSVPFLSSCRRHGFV
jgi:hypothetical protein